MQVVGYTANGEASDWLLHDQGIVTFSPELGNAGNEYDDKYFFPDR